MNLWFINHYAVPPTQPGITRHHTLARELIRRGHTVTIVASSFDHLTRRETRLEPHQAWAHEDIEGVRYVWVRTPEYSGNTAARILNMGVFAARLARGAMLGRLPAPDAVLGSSPHLFAAWAAEQIARRFGVPFVLEVRDLWPQSLIDLGHFTPGHPLVRVLERLERHLYTRASAVVSVLPGIESHLIARGASPERLFWVPNGVDLHGFPEPRPPREDGVLTVMYAGAHGHANGLETVTEAASILAAQGLEGQIHFRLVGDGPEKSALVDWVAARGLTNVAFEPPVPKSAVFEKLVTADAFVMPLRPAPLFKLGISPNKLFDYMAAARPIIFAIESDYDPVTRSGAGFAVPPGDATALASACQRLAALSAEARYAMGRQGRHYVATHHDVKDLAARLESALASAIGGIVPQAA